MKQIILALTCALLVPSSTTAAGLGSSVRSEWDDPVVVPPTGYAPPLRWTGPYGGFSYNWIERTRTLTTTETNLGYTTLCPEGKSCDPRVPGELVGNPFINGLPDKDWSLPRDHPNANCGQMTITCVTTRVDNGNATRLWVPADTPLVVDEVERLVFFDQGYTDTEFGAFLGYRGQVFDTSMIWGIEANFIEDGTWVEAQFGYDAGPALPYVALDHEGDFGIGIDVMITKHIFAGAKAYEDVRQLRTGWTKHF